jgi:Zinc finger, C3HC4 type (RING finger)
MMDNASNSPAQNPKSDAAKDADDLPEASNDDDSPSKVSSPAPTKRRKRKVYNGMIECSVDPIRSLITCSLCDGLYREPYTTLKCFHTFCKSCLVTAIKSSYNTPQYNCCPTCAIYFGRDDVLANVALPDRILETLIDKVIFPDIAYQDYVKECEFYAQRGIERKDATADEQNPSASAAPWASTVSKKGNTNDPKKKKGPPIAGGNPDTPEIRLHDPKDSIAFLLMPKATAGTENSSLPPPLPLPRLTTSVQLRVEQVKKLLSKKLSREPSAIEGFSVYCNGCLLEEELSLRFISYAIWKDPNKTLTLEYDYNR